MSELSVSFYRRCVRLAVRMATFLLIAGSLVRLTIRDHVPILSMIYYGTPVVILALSAAFVGIYMARRGQHWLSIGLFTVAVAWGLSGCITEIRSAPSLRSADDTSALLWNMRNGDSGWEGAFQRFCEVRPELAGLVESHNGGHELAFATHLPEGYQCSETKGSMTIVAQGEIDEVACHSLGPHGNCLTGRVTMDGQKIRVIVVDLESNPAQSRRPALVELRALVDQFLDERLLVMGDFNTPYDSTHFELLKTDLTHAFRTRGNGYAATWPLPIPVLELDHVWFNDKIVVSECRHARSKFSDHELVKFYYRVVK